MSGCLRERVGQREAGLDVLADGDEDLTQLVVLRLLLDDVERPEQRHARVHHRRELAGGDDELVRLDPAEAREDVARARGSLLLDVDDDQALRAQLRRDGLLVAGLHLPLAGDAGEVECLECEGGHGLRRPYRAHEATELVRGGRARLGELAGDLVLAHQLRRARRPWSACRARRRSGAPSRSGASCPRGSGCGPRASARAPRWPRVRPCPSAVGRSCCVTMPWRDTDSCTRTCCCCSGGNTSTIRSTVWAVSCVWSVANTRWPVSAAVSAVEIVSRSLISPTRITSGSWRSAAFRPRLEALRIRAELALVDDALLVPVQELDRVLDREDVLVAGVVDQVEHRGERRGLAGAGRPGHEHEAARLLRELLEHRRQRRASRASASRAGSGGRRPTARRAGSTRSRGSGPSPGSSRRGRSANRSPGAGAARS